ncbi:MAG: hypothetical protein KJ645_03435 [Planctomycetes bacterium]|nr:hypothetical protein [Planctomycetota bacterium]
MTGQADAGGNSFKYVYRNSGTVARVERPDGSVFKYAGRVMMNDFAGDTGTESEPFSFADSMGLSFTNGESVDYVYNKAGQLTVKTLSTGEIFTYDYDDSTGMLKARLLARPGTSSK